MTFLANITIDVYRNRAQIKEFTDEQLADFQRAAHSTLTREELAETYSDIQAIVDGDEINQLIDLGFKPEIRRVKGVHYPSPLPSVADIAEGHRPQIVNVSVAGPSLMAVQTVTWLEDACTEELQGALSDGWRLIAVCPPNDSRRPTYIIGHTEVGKRT